MVAQVACVQTSAKKSKKMKEKWRKGKENNEKEKKLKNKRNGNQNAPQLETSPSCCETTKMASGLHHVAT